MKRAGDPLDTEAFQNEQDFSKEQLVTVLNKLVEEGVIWLGPDERYRTFEHALQMASLH